MKEINHKEHINKLYQLLDTLSQINSMQDVNKLLKFILRAIKRVMSAEASSILLLDPEHNELFFSKVEGGSDKVKEIRFKATEGIAGHVIKTGRPMLVNEVHKSKYFLKTIDQQTEFETKSLVCVPLVNRNKTIGVLEAVNKTKGGKFSKEDERLFMAFADQISIAIDNARLYNMAFYDELTQIFMRRYFEAWLEQEYARVKRYQTHLSVIMFDIDHFKKINDSYGHQAGDYILAELAKIVKGSVRQADIVARYGGEEFIICLPETTPDKAKHSAERIRQAVEKGQFKYDGKKIPVTASLGVASFQTSPENSPKKFVKDADEALYQSKKAGRNRVTVYNPAKKRSRKRAA